MHVVKPGAFNDEINTILFDVVNLEVFKFSLAKVETDEKPYMSIYCHIALTNNFKPYLNLSTPYVYSVRKTDS